MGHWKLLLSIEKALNRAQDKHKKILHYVVRCGLYLYYKHLNLHLL